MWLNSMQREEPYLALITLFFGTATQVLHGCRQLVS